MGPVLWGVKLCCGVVDVQRDVWLLSFACVVVPQVSYRLGVLDWDTLMPKVVIFS